MLRRLRSGTVRTCGGLLCAALLASCYRYAPAALSVQPDAYVRLRLTEAGAAQLAARLGAGVTSVAGRVVSADGDAIVLAVAETERADGRYTWSGEEVPIPRSAAASAESRSLDPWRTLGLAAAGIVGGVLIAVLIKAAGSSAGGSDDGGGGVIVP